MHIFTDECRTIAGNCSVEEGDTLQVTCRMCEGGAHYNDKRSSKNEGTEH